MSAPYEEVPRSHRKCGECGKELSSRQGLADHFRMKHGRDPRVTDFLPVTKQQKPEQDDESFASRAIQASIDHACGVNNPDYDWLVEPFE